jgi:hypothetical protein
MIQTKRNIDSKIALQPQADEFFNNIRQKRSSEFAGQSRSLCHCEFGVSHVSTKCP